MKAKPNRAATACWQGLSRAPPATFTSFYKRFGNRLLYASSDNPNLSIYAARKDDNTLTLLIINLGADEKTTPLKPGNFTPANAVRVWRFDAGRNAERIGEEQLGDDNSIVLPEQSITLYEIVEE